LAKRLLGGAGVAGRIAVCVLTPAGPKILKIELPRIDTRDLGMRRGSCPGGRGASTKRSDLDDVAFVPNPLGDALDDAEVAFTHPPGHREIVGHSALRERWIQRNVYAFIQAAQFPMRRRLEKECLEQSARFRAELLRKAGAPAVRHPPTTQDQAVVDVCVFID